TMSKSKNDSGCGDRNPTLTPALNPILNHNLHLNLALVCHLRNCARFYRVLSSRLHAVAHGHALAHGAAYFSTGLGINIFGISIAPKASRAKLTLIRANEAEVNHEQESIRFASRY